MLVTRTHTDFEVILVDNAVPDDVSPLLQQLAEELAAVSVIRSQTRLRDSAARNLGAAAATGDVVVFLTATTSVGDGWLPPLRAALDGGAAAVQPLLLAPDGTIVTTGMTPGAQGPLRDVLRGFPGDDRRAAVAGHRTAVGHHCFAVRADAFSAVGGLRPKLPPSEAAADLSLRVVRAGLGDVRYQPEAIAVTGDRKVRNPVPGHASEWTGSDGTGSMRWAIKIAAPFARRHRWGDFHFASGLAAALRRQGQDVVIDSIEAWYRETARHDDVVLVLRGLQVYEPRPEHYNLLWVISHSSEVTPAEWSRYDHGFVATTNPLDSAAGFDVEPLLQATDAHRFSPGPSEPELHHDVLFIGNSRWTMRPVVRHALDADLPLSVYGDGWSEYLPEGILKGTLIPNDQLPRYYRSAGVVLNDHWTDMRRDGLLSNRLFDLAACGAVFVTDTVDGLHGVFGDELHTYDQPQDLGPLVGRLLSDPGPAQRRLELANYIRSHHSFDVRARRLVTVAQERIADQC